MKSLQYALLVFCMATNVIAQEYLLYCHPKKEAIYSMNISTKQEDFLYQSESHVSTPYLVNKDTLVFNEVAHDGCVGYSLKEKKYLFNLGWHYDICLGKYIIESDFTSRYGQEIKVYDMDLNVDYKFSLEDTNFVMDENVLETDRLSTMDRIDEKVILLLKISPQDKNKHILWLVNLEDKYASKIKEIDDGRLPLTTDYAFSGDKDYFYVSKYDNDLKCYSIILFNLKENEVKKINKNYVAMAWYSNDELVVTKDRKHAFLYNVETDQVTNLFSHNRVLGCRCIEKEKIFFFYDSPILPVWLNPGGFLTYDFLTNKKNHLKRLGYQIYNYGEENWRPYCVSDNGEIINYH